jgi:hypothetical protein
MRNAGTIPEVVLSARSLLARALLARAGQQRRWFAAVRPTRTVRLRWLTGEDLRRGVLSYRRFEASGTVNGAGFAR